MDSRYADPLNSPCTCGYSPSRCELDHPYHSIDLRGSYKRNCKVEWLITEGAAQQPAVDHVIELWEVRRAFYKAIVTFDQFNDYDDWYDCFESECPSDDEILEILPDSYRHTNPGNLDAFHSPDAEAQADTSFIPVKQIHLAAADDGDKPDTGPQVNQAQMGPQRKNSWWWTSTPLETVRLLDDLKKIFNSSMNLCLIDGIFNGDKNKFLTFGENERLILASGEFKELFKGNSNGNQRTRKWVWTYPGQRDLPWKPTKGHLRAYYEVTEDNRNLVLETLAHRFLYTKNLMYWAIRRILMHEHDAFLEECSDEPKLLPILPTVSRDFGRETRKKPSAKATKSMAMSPSPLPNNIKQGGRINNAVGKPGIVMANFRDSERRPRSQKSGGRNLRDRNSSDRNSRDEDVAEEKRFGRGMNKNQNLKKKAAEGKGRKNFM